MNWDEVYLYAMQCCARHQNKDAFHNVIMKDGFIRNGYKKLLLDRLKLYGYPYFSSYMDANATGGSGARIILPEILVYEY